MGEENKLDCILHVDYQLYPIPKIEVVIFHLKMKKRSVKRDGGNSSLKIFSICVFPVTSGGS